MKKRKIFFYERRKVLYALLLCIACFLNVSLVMAQNITVKGTVNDAYGPVIGANIVDKDYPSNGTITDIDGNFSLMISPKGTIVVRFVGYQTQEIPVNGQTTIQVTLQEDTEMLEEVVVVGYGTMRKKDLTGSVVQIRPEKIADTNPSSVQDVLRGTPGLQIGYDASAKGTDASIQLRGKNSR